MLNLRNHKSWLNVRNYYLLKLVLSASMSDVLLQDKLHILKVKKVMT